MTLPNGYLDQAPRAIGSGYLVGFRYSNGQLETDWSPAIVTVPRLPCRARNRLFRRYQTERGSFLARLARELAINIAVVDL